MDSAPKKSADLIPTHKPSLTVVRDLKHTQKSAHPEHKFVEMIMRQQIKIAKEKLREETKVE